jgi:hypothetical protein
MTTLEHVLIKVSHHPSPLYHSFPTPRLMVRDVKWSDEEIKGWMTNPFECPLPELWRHTSCQAGRTARQRSCVQIYNLRDVS